MHRSFSMPAITYREHTSAYHGMRRIPTTLALQHQTAGHNRMVPIAGALAAVCILGPPQSLTGLPDGCLWVQLQALGATAA